jgi:hypothetical protein
MVWKRNSTILLLMLPLLLLAQEEEIQLQQDGTDSVAIDYVEGDPGAMNHPGGQTLFQSETLSGKQASEKAMEERSARLNYEEVEPKKKDPKRPRMPDFKAPTNLEGLKDIIFWIAILLLAGGLIFLLFKTGKPSLARKRTPLAGPLEWEDAWNLNTETLEVTLQDAVESGDFRKAIRLLYLKNLRRLIDSDWVKPSPEKTNTQYLQELQEANLDVLFGKTTRIYETVWYGEAVPNALQYKQMAPVFHELYERARRA